MAAANIAHVEEGVSCSPDNLVCPLCLDVFEDATLLVCEHTFCRKCLKRYDASHLDRDHMVCPICRSDTMLQENRVEGLPANVTANGLVDDYHDNAGGLYASLDMLEDTPNCNACKVQDVAVSYCTHCRNYMCESCHHGHQRMTCFFEHHKTLSISEVTSGKYNITQHPVRCPIHTQETKDMFCEMCKVYICYWCVIVAHRDHTITNHSDYKRELRLKVDNLVERCKDKKTELEKNIQNTEARRKEVHAAVQKLETEVRDAYEKKSRQLKENERVLIENLQSLKKGFDDDLDVLKAKDRQRIKSIVSSVSLVANDRLGCLEADSLAAHCLLCDELEQILIDVKDDTSSDIISGTAQRMAFISADACDGTLLGEIAKGFTRLSRTVDLRNWVNGMTAVSEDTLLLCYGLSKGADKVDTKGNASHHFPQDGIYCDLAHQSHSGNTVVSICAYSNELRMHSPNGSYMHGTKIANAPYRFQMISSNSKGEVIIANSRDIMIYNPSLSTQLCRFMTKDAPWQAFETRSGAIVASTCNRTNPSKVTAYDRRGRVGDTLTSNRGKHLYAAVDTKDRVYVASVNRTAGKVVITQYKMDGLKFKKVIQLKELKLTLDCFDSWCYMVSLTCDMLAFASGTNVHFIEVLPS